MFCIIVFFPFLFCIFLFIYCSVDIANKKIIEENEKRVKFYEMMRIKRAEKKVKKFSVE
jgi:hypothetical protein